MRLVVCDTSPLVFLDALGRQDLLVALFDAVWVPEAVVAELEAGTRAGHPAVDLAAIDNVEIRPDLAPLPAWLARDLGPGELAVMAIALASGANNRVVVLLDDALARRVAREAGLDVWGTLRVLLEGKKAGHLRAVVPLLDQLRTAGMHISDRLVAQVRALAGE